MLEAAGRRRRPFVNTALLGAAARSSSRCSSAPRPAILLNQNFRGRGVRALDDADPLGRAGHRRGDDLGVDVPHRVRDHQLHADRARASSTKPVGWLTNTRHGACRSLIAINVWKLFPFVAIMVLAGLQSIPNDLYEAARVDGASFWDEVRHIMLPLVRPVLVAVTLLLVIWGLNAITIIYAITRGGPANQTLITPIQIFRLAFESVQFNQAAALSVMFFARRDRHRLHLHPRACGQPRGARDDERAAALKRPAIGWRSLHRRRSLVVAGLPVPVRVDGAVARSRRCASSTPCRRIWWPEQPTLDNYCEGALRDRTSRATSSTRVIISVGATGARAAAGDLRVLRLRALRLPRQAVLPGLRPDRAAAADGGDHRAALHHAARARAGQHLLGADPRLHDHDAAALGLDADELLPGDPRRARGSGDHRRRSRLGVLFRITLPLSLPGLVAVIVYAFVTTWNEFIFALCFATDSLGEDAADRASRSSRPSSTPTGAR